MPGRSIRFNLDGELLAQQREHAGLTQEAFATALLAAGAREVSRGAVANWETGRTKPGAATFKVLVGVLADIHDIKADEVLRRLRIEAAA